MPGTDWEWDKIGEREWDLDLEDSSSSPAHHLSAVTLGQQSVITTCKVNITGMLTHHEVLWGWFKGLWHTVDFFQHILIYCDTSFTFIN